MEKKRVIILTFGPLHLIKTAESLAHLVDVEVIQGWIPAWWNRWLLPFINKLAGRNVSRTILKRTPSILNGRNRGFAFADFVENFVRRFVKNSVWRDWLDTQIMGTVRSKCECHL